MRSPTANPAQQREIISRRLLRAMGLLVVLSLALVTYARVTERPLEAKPAAGPIAQERVIRIEADKSGAARVFDVDGTLIVDMPETKGGFVAGVWRAMTFERGKAGIDPDAPVRLVRYKDGGLAMFDEVGGTRLDLIGFGADNAAAFSRLLNE